MARITLAETEPSVPTESLEELIPRYALNKGELDSYTKICKQENEQIKAALVELGESEYSAGGYTVKRVVVTKESMDEAKLIAVLRKHGITAPIMTREYVDMDSLEAYLYNNMPSINLAVDIDSCRTTSETVQLRISRTKASKGE